MDLRKPVNQPVKKIKNKIDFLGGNEKKIVFLVYNENHKFLDDSQLTFLSGLILACNITLADIAVINLHYNKEVTYLDLFNEFQSQKILSFGVQPSRLDLPFSIPYFQVQAFQEIEYLFSPGLEELRVDLDKKKQLWISLQKIFNIRIKK
ncbi:MAG: hypothetical protein M3Z92_07625 [Bacteroidota bacterium]|nr:hypothetical protein [Bacteroidota bacterium]MDQ6888712.1 hypothetical protein [Bacteroidota bacterium]